MTIQELERTLDGRKPGIAGVTSSFSVLVPLVERDGALFLLFERRADTLAHQPGEVCFPGGFMEPGESPEACALRETEEELAIPPSTIRILGRLDCIHHPDDSLMYPVLGLLDAAVLPHIVPSPEEVAEAFLVPLSFFRAHPPRVYHIETLPQVGEAFPYEEIDAAGGYAWRSHKMQVVVYPRYEGHVVWGLTGRIVHGLTSWLSSPVSAPEPADAGQAGPGTLFLISTPIGNLGDLSARAAETLAEVDFIAAEDTRVTLKLLNHLGLRKPLMSYHRHNKEAGGDAVLGRVLAGESCALVTDAGTPAISDPGEELVGLCAAQGVPVVPVPGPCALVTALSVSGLPTGRFSFEGFLPMNRKNRRAHLDALRQETRTMVFYEAPHKLAATLGDLRDTLGPARKLSLCRELTKLHEEVRRTTLGEAADWYASHTPRGEFVLVVEGGRPPEEASASLEDGLLRVEALYGSGLSFRDAVRTAAADLSLSRKELYAAATRKKAEKEPLC